MIPLDRSTRARVKAQYRRDLRSLSDHELANDLKIAGLPLWVRRALGAEQRRREALQRPR